jgi:hypothetical protein
VGVAIEILIARWPFTGNTLNLPRTFELRIGAPMESVLFGGQSGGVTEQWLSIALLFAAGYGRLQKVTWNGLRLQPRSTGDWFVCMGEKSTLHRSSVIFGNRMFLEIQPTVNVAGSDCLTGGLILVRD